MTNRVEYEVELPMYGIYKTRVHARDEEEAIEMAEWHNTITAMRTE